jgi:ankyrin repeat protein
MSSCAADNPASLLAREALYKAAEQGNRHQLYAVIFQARDTLNEKNPETGMTPLQAAKRNGHKQVARILINFGARVHEVNPNADPASVSLHAASEKGDPKFLAAVLPLPTEKLNKRDPLSGLTPLMYAIRGNHVEVAKILIEAGADLNQCDANGTPPIAIATRDPNTTMLKLLVDKGAAVDAKDTEERTALLIAASSGSFDAVQLLLNHGADIEAVDSSNNTALSEAIGMRDKEMMTLLLKNKASTEHEVLAGGTTPLSWAIRLGNVEGVELLLSYGAKVNHVDDGGDSLITIAARKGHTKIVELLINAGADLAQENNNLRTPLCAAALNGHLQTVGLLLDSDKNVEQATRNCQRALELAVKKNHPAVVELLLKRGAKVDEKIAQLAENPVIGDLLDHAALFAHATREANDEDHVMARTDGGKLIAGLMSVDRVSKGRSADQWSALLQNQGICKTVVNSVGAAASNLPAVWTALAGSNQPRLTPKQRTMWCAGILANLEHDDELRTPYSNKELSAGTEASLNQIASRQVAAMTQAGLDVEGALKAHTDKLWSTCRQTTSDDRCDPFVLYNHLAQECGFYAEVAKLIASAFADVWSKRDNLGSVTLEQAFARELVERRNARKWVASINSVSADSGNHQTFTMLMFRQIDLIDAWCKKTLPSN